MSDELRVRECLYGYCPQRTELCKTCDEVRAALARMDDRRGEDVDEWAAKQAMTDEQLLDFLGVAKETPENRAKLLRSITPEKRALYERMSKLETVKKIVRLELYQDASDLWWLEGEGVCVCNRDVDKILDDMPAIVRLRLRLRLKLQAETND